MNLLIAGAWHPAKEHFLELENLGHRIVFLQNESDVLPCAPEWVEGIVCNALFLFHEIGQFVNLQYIQLTSAGFDRVPMSYVQPHHIEIHNAHGVYSIPMAESALCGVLQLYRHSRFFCRESKKAALGKASRFTGGIRQNSMYCRLRKCRKRMRKEIRRLRLRCCRYRCESAQRCIVSRNLPAFAAEPSSFISRYRHFNVAAHQ